MRLMTHHQSAPCTVCDAVPMWGRSRSGRRKRGDGSRGPLSSSRGRGFFYVTDFSGLVALNAIAFVVLLSLVARGLVTHVGLPLAMVGFVAWPLSSIAITAIAQRSARRRDRYGGEDDEVIRFMESTSEEVQFETWPQEVDSWLIEV